MFGVSPVIALLPDCVHLFIVYTTRSKPVRIILCIKALNYLELAHCTLLSKIITVGTLEMIAQR